MATTPGLGFPMLGILEGADYLQKLLIAWNAADILRRTGSRAVNTGRVLGSAFEEKQIFDFYGMAPVVAKIIDVGERRARVAEISQPDLALVKDLRIADGRSFRSLNGISVTQSPDLELMEMIIPPVKGRLDSEVKLLQVPFTWHDETPPDGWFDLVDRDSDLHSVGRSKHGSKKIGNA
mgnify:CR=1 FL=1